MIDRLREISAPSAKRVPNFTYGLSILKQKRILHTLIEPSADFDRFTSPWIAFLTSRFQNMTEIDIALFDMIRNHNLQNSISPTRRSLKR